MPALKWLLIVSAPLTVAVVVALVLVTRPGNSGASRLAALAHVRIGETPARVTAFVGKPDEVSLAHMVRLSLLGNPSTRYGHGFVIRVDRSNFRVPKIVETYWYGDLYSSGSHEFVFTNGRLRAKYRY